MQVVITGGTGFVGTHLSARLLDGGHEVTAIGTRDAEKVPERPQFRYLQADTCEPGPWQEAAAQADLLVNLAGRTIFHRWSPKYKQQIYDSRILTTRHLVAAMESSPKSILISASAVGFYGDCGDSELTETSPRGQGYLADISRDWEAEALAAGDKGARVVVTRFGIVLGDQGGALATMLPAFRSFVGGPLGSGRQWFPWIHIDDLLAALDFLISQPDLHGVFNLCAPNPVRNSEMARALGSALGRPAKVPMPSMALKLMLGELASVLLASQRTLPSRLVDAGFQFRYPLLDGALADLLA